MQPYKHLTSSFGNVIVQDSRRIVLDLTVLFLVLVTLPPRETTLPRHHKIPKPAMSQFSIEKTTGQAGLLRTRLISKSNLIRSLCDIFARLLPFHVYDAWLIQNSTNLQGLFVPFARIGSGDPVRVLRLFHNKYTG